MSEESVKNEMGSLENVLGMMDRVNEVFSYGEHLLRDKTAPRYSLNPFN